MFKPLLLFLGGKKGSWIRQVLIKGGSREVCLSWGQCKGRDNPDHPGVGLSRDSDKGRDQP